VPGLKSEVPDLRPGKTRLKGTPAVEAIISVDMLATSTFSAYIFRLLDLVILFELKKGPVVLLFNLVSSSGRDATLIAAVAISVGYSHVIIALVISHFLQFEGPCFLLRISVISFGTHFTCRCAVNAADSQPGLCCFSLPGHQPPTPCHFLCIWS